MYKKEVSAGCGETQVFEKYKANIFRVGELVRCGTPKTDPMRSEHL